MSRSIYALAVVLAFATPIQADSPSTIRPTLAALYHKEDLAADAKDAFGALACYDPNVQIFDKAGNQTGYNDQLQAMQTSFQVVLLFFLLLLFVLFVLLGVVVV